METFIFLLEIIGTVAFASSGALTAMEKRMDLFGVNVLGVVTAVGGGIMRDVILGLTPPAAFSRPVYVLTAAVVSTVLFAAAYLHPSVLDGKLRHGLYEKLMFWCDTFGLGIFTMVGIRAASQMLQEENVFFLLFTGVLTGVGGGTLRDIFSDQMPDIFRKHIYALASIAGAAAMLLVRRALAQEEISILCGLLVVILIRWLAAHFLWNLPRIPERRPAEEAPARSGGEDRGGET